MAKYIQTDSSDQVSHRIDETDTEAHARVRLEDAEAGDSARTRLDDTDTEGHRVRFVGEADPADLISEDDTEGHLRR